MFNRKQILVIGVSLAIAVLSIIGVVYAQQRTVSQAWQYAIIIQNVQDNTYVFASSPLYEGNDNFTPIMPLENQQAVWDAVANSGSASLVDYLAVMGLTGYELVDVASPVTGALIYYFKRPASAS